MNSSKLWSRKTLWLTAAGAFLVSSGCSVLYDFNTSQCETEDSDCGYKGPQFANSICKNHVCVRKVLPSTGGSSSLSTGGKSGTTGGATSPGGTSAQGGQNPGGDSSTGGTPACINADCMAQHLDPWTCINGTCTELETNDCPVVITTNNITNLLKQPAPIILGGFASMTNPSILHDTLAVINWDLAFDEFNSNTLGLPSYDNTGQRRPLIGLMCHGDVTSTDQINSAMQHLTQEYQLN